MKSSWSRLDLLVAGVFALAGLLTFAGSAHAAGKIRAVTTITDLAEFTRAVGGDLVEVNSLATGVEDPHGIPLKPSYIPLLNRADVVVTVGLGLEHAFLPALLDASRNPKILPGKPGYIDCSRNVEVLEVPRSLDKAEGDVHRSATRTSISIPCGRRR